MYTFNYGMYEALASEIYSSLRCRCYFSGTAETEDGDTLCRLTASLIIYRRQTSPLSDDYGSVVNVVPVWWECRTFGDGGEVANDFDFDLLRSAMLGV